MFGELGGFDSLNPFVLKGRAPWGARTLIAESLMARNFDEPFAVYGLLAETIEVPEDRSWVAFTLREGALFSDGSPVTTEDVIWSFETLGTEGHPRYRGAWSGVSKIDATGPRTVRIDFAEPNRELPLIMGLRPILKKAQFEGRDFAATGQEAPIGSGAYRIAASEPGRFIEFERNPDWWGADLPVNRGLNNFDTVRFEYFRDAGALWEAVRAGQISIFYDNEPVRWVEGYDFPAARDGTLQQGAIAHSRPTGLEGFGFNTRRPIFQDRRVRLALEMSFDWEWINSRLFRDQYTRIESAFGNSPLGFSGAAEGREAEILAPFTDLPEGTLEEGWRPTKSDGSGRDRRVLRRAMRLLKDAGWTVEENVLRNAAGEAFTFEILVQSKEHETLASLWRETLDKLGIDVAVRLVDSAQYQQRLVDYDYDMIHYIRRMSLSPGTEQQFYFGSEGRDQPGTRNYMGVADPATDAAVQAMLAARTAEDFRAAVKAHDRVLNAGVYVVPFGVLPDDRLVWRSEFQRPARAALYGYWGWWAGAGTWWHAP
ncbi:MAG: extracellular solute-binding protein [Paracoccaceae bacterium]